MPSSDLDNHIALHWNIAERLTMILNYHAYLYFIMGRRYGVSHKYTKRLNNTIHDYQIQIKGYLDGNLICTAELAECEKNHIPLTDFYYRNNVKEIEKYMERPINVSRGGTAMYQKPRNLRQEEYNYLLKQCQSCK